MNLQSRTLYSTDKTLKQSESLTVYDFLEEMDQRERRRVEKRDISPTDGAHSRESDREIEREVTVADKSCDTDQDFSMLGDTEEATRRRPFEFLSNIFKRRREQEDIGSDIKPPEIRFEESDFYNQSWVNDHGQESYQQPAHISKTAPSLAPSSAAFTSTPSPIRSPIMIATATVGIPLVGSVSGALVTSSPSFMTLQPNGQSSSPAAVTSLCSSPIILHQTPIKSRDIGEDMEAIRLSRQDNPYLQKVAGSETSLSDEDILESGPSVEEEDTTHLVSQSRMNQDNALSISEVHEHLIRSPPPTSVPKALNGKGIFIFPAISGDTESHTGSTKGITSSGKAQSLNPLVSKGHEDVLDQHLRQVLDTQRKLSNPKGDMSALSCSVPGSPARVPAHSLSLQIRRPSHSRTLSEEASTISNTGAGAAVGGGYTNEAAVLAPVLPPGRKQPSPNEVLLTRPLLSSTTTPSFTAPLLPLNRNTRTKKNFCTKGASTNVLQTTISGSSSSLTLPIKCPHQPASSKIT